MGEDVKLPKQDFNEFIETCTEHELFFVIDEAGAFIWRMNHNIDHGNIPAEDMDGVTKDIISINQMQGEAAKQTKRFGVNFELVTQQHEPTGREIKIPCPEYWTWLKHWNNWKNAFNDDTWAEFMKAVSNKESLESFLPTKRWHEQ